MQQNTKCYYHVKYLMIEQQSIRPLVPETKNLQLGGQGYNHQKGNELQDIDPLKIFIITKIIMQVQK